MDRKIEILKAFSAVCLCCSMSKDDYPTKELDLIADVLAEAQEKQATSDKTSDKYRWHDLRKNPNDLPTKEGLYAVAVKYFAEEKSEMGFGQFENMYGYGSGWSAIIPSYGNVIAWKEIEPFEEGEV